MYDASGAFITRVSVLKTMYLVYSRQHAIEPDIVGVICEAIALLPQT